MIHRYYTLLEARDTSSVKTVRFFPTTTFKLAIWYVGLFSLSVIVIFGFIYWSTATFMATQTDTAIEAEIQALADLCQGLGVVIIQAKAQPDHSGFSAAQFS